MLRITAALFMCCALTSAAGSADFVGSRAPAGSYPPPDQVHLDVRQCAVWAARKSGAASFSGIEDMRQGAFHGSIGGTITGTIWGAGNAGGWIGMGLGATYGAVTAMLKQRARNSAFAYCMQTKGYYLG